MSEITTIGVVQARFGDDVQENVARVVGFIRGAAADGANVIVTPELFESRYFPKVEDEEFFELARPLAGHPTIQAFSQLAAELGVVLPVSFFERAGHAYYNSLAMIDADGTVLGVYRKSHIPDGPGYEEKFYFRPGDTGFRVWPTKFGMIGVGICWDQWFPEAAREMALAGAEILLYPTAIGSEPADPTQDTSQPWRRVMQGHAVANVTPIGAANRVGDEEGQVFYGSSFLSDHRGEIVASLGRDDEGYVVASFDRGALRRYRASFGFFRDRRPDLYRAIANTLPRESGA
ncbi:MAG: N-carbamoylputrescine amidase [Hyphomicrobiaceae bacterium]|jgi:N-carbamoylputrescine amidase